MKKDKVSKENIKEKNTNLKNEELNAKKSKNETLSNQTLNKQYTNSQNTKTVKTKKTKKRNFVVILFFIIIALSLFIMFKGAYLEKLEIGEQYVSVFWKNFQYKTISLITTFVLIFLAVYITNKRISSGLKEFFDDEKRKMPKLPNKSVSFIIAGLVSLFTSNFTMNKLILFLNSTSFEIQDKIFYNDIGYYLFQKPFLEYIVWFILITIIALTVYAGAYYIIALNTQFDGVRSETLKKSKISKQLLNNVKIVAVLIAVITFLKTQDLSSTKFLTIGDTTTYSLYGAGLADVSIKLWGYRLLSVVIVISAFLAISYYNKGKTKKVIGSILTVPIYLCLLLFTLVGYNTMFVNSNELDRQKDYINYNIENTRSAYNIAIDETSISNAGALSNEDIIANAKLLSNVSIVNKDLVLQNLNGTLTHKGYYTYNSSKIGQYLINGEEKIVYVSPREIVNKDNSYINSTYEYTHGYGVIATSVTSTSNSGNLENYQKTFTDTDLNISEPRIYFGLQTNETIVTNSTTKNEFDYPVSEGKNETNKYDGEAGLQLGFLDRMVLAVSQGDIKLAFSSDIDSNNQTFFYLNESTSALNKSNANITMLKNLLDSLSQINPCDENLDDTIKNYNNTFKESMNSIYANTEIIEKFTNELIYIFASENGQPTLDEIKRSRRFDVMLDLADIESNSLHNDYIGTEHLLLAAIREEGSFVSTFFQRYNIKIMDARFLIMDLQNKNLSSMQQFNSESALDSIFKSIFDSTQSLFSALDEEKEQKQKNANEE